MTNLFERLRRALAPQYQVERELASGGMGIVYLGHDPALRRQVAIKILRPELATATAAARFLREARLLAKLNHRAVVTIYQAGEADGLFYYVMELVRGETLADRIASGRPFDESQLMTLARELLDGLEAIHQLGIVHRDLKPANILFRGDQAVIADFGIALSEATTSTEGSTLFAHAGTPAYMSPEQMGGDPITPASDIHNVGMVLYEVATGRPWRVTAPLDRSLFKEVPTRLVEPIARALAYQASDRWPSARAMSAALDAGHRARRAWIAGGALVVTAAVALTAVARNRPDRLSPGVMSIRVAPTGGGPSSLAESVTVALQNRLAVNPDFHLTTGGGRPSVEIMPNVRLVGERIELTAKTRGPALPRDSQFTALSGERRRLLELADSLADRISESILLGETADRWFPLKARPTTPEGKAFWLRAERAYGRGEWEQADQLYGAAFDKDTTCFLCRYRSYDVDRWLGRGVSPEQMRWLVGHEDRFPAHYQALIRANALPWPARFDSLRAAAVSNRDFALAWFAAGDEAFHRGPLHGGAQRDALEYLSRVTTLKPRFAPAWEHLAWLSLAIGDSGTADRALASLSNTPVGGGFPGALRAELGLGFAWRFLSEDVAKKATDRIRAEPSILAYKDVAAGPRVLMTMGSPNGALYFGIKFAAETGRSDLVEPGLLAALYGATALGMTDSAASIRDQLGRTAGRALELFLAEWEVVASELDGETDGSQPARLLAARNLLAEIAKEPSAQPTHRQRAAWLLALTAGGPAPYRPDSTSVPSDLGAVLAADAAARRGDWKAAVRITDAIPTLDVKEPTDQFLPLLLRLRRATWLERDSQPGAARQALRSGEHLEYINFPTGGPQAGEVDWAFGTEVAWRRAAFLARIGTAQGELCQVYQDIARLWRRGAPRQAAKADSAAQRAKALSCARAP